MNRAICAPCGGLMNHVRWLTLMSSEFKLTSNSKLSFMKRIYPPERLPFVWLKNESLHRERSFIKNAVFGTHYIEDCLTLKVPRKILILVPSPLLSFIHYLKFNPVLNGLVKQAVDNPLMSIDDIKKSYQLAISNDNDRNKLYSASNNDIITLDIDKLYTDRELDVGIYNTIVDFFEISNEYSLANEVHHLWFDLQECGKKAMLTLSKNAKDVENYWRLYNLKIINQSEYDIALKLINETYRE
jgi:hypothetical protein